MSCDRPSGPAASLFRDEHRKFPPNWEGDLPKKESREELAQKMEPGFKARNLSPEQIQEVLDFMEKYEDRYYEDGDGQCYHRACGGGSVVQGELGVYCSKCGKLPDLFPPAFLR